MYFERRRIVRKIWILAALLFSLCLSVGCEDGTAGGEAVPIVVIADNWDSDSDRYESNGIQVNARDENIFFTAATETGELFVGDGSYVYLRDYTFRNSKMLAWRYISLQPFEGDFLQIIARLGGKVVGYALVKIEKDGDRYRASLQEGRYLSAEEIAAGRYTEEYTEEYIGRLKRPMA